VVELGQNAHDEHRIQRLLVTAEMAIISSHSVMTGKPDPLDLQILPHGKGHAVVGLCH
jgi:hypothetical protein